MVVAGHLVADGMYIFIPDFWNNFYITYELFKEIVMNIEKHMSKTVMTFETRLSSCLYYIYTIPLMTKNPYGCKWLDVIWLFSIYKINRKNKEMKCENRNKQQKILMPVKTCIVEIFQHLIHCNHEYSNITNSIIWKKSVSMLFPYCMLKWWNLFIKFVFSVSSCLFFGFNWNIYVNLSYVRIQ